ncbi:triose-phosphate isomerase [Motiliproteus sp. MSK22-1]|uniref:triose-phosphate isomerase n=1 Tax=Motiliproteus sp. MSK22-1 TaxID=1897630 RepID=UPI0009774B83|nr:triose-phosphate isomerase [Motiliproteus sp. MSK22-1]OMH33790.1 triose-phosphate isomerase [Motiliproteus sp. MSK22-1]
MRTPLVIGNWKMHGTSASNHQLLEQLLPLLKPDTQVAIAVCPPYPYLSQVKAMIGGNLALGAQNLNMQEKGAHTGEVSGPMLKDTGCRYVLVGHSERREIYGESDLIIAEKFAVAVASELIPVLCVGETLKQRKTGQSIEVVSSQIKSVIQRNGIQSFANAVIAYEPVWAIGTGETATPAQAQEVHQKIRELIGEYDISIAETLPLLYGGSVNASNATSLFNQPDVDGGLVGGASLNAESFAAICQAAS